MKAGDIGIIDHPVTNGGAIARIVKVTTARVSVEYYKGQGIWSKAATRKVNVWHPLVDISDLDRKHLSLTQLFANYFVAKRDLEAAFQAQIAGIASVVQADKENNGE